MATLTHEMAIGFFNQCQTPLECFDLYRHLNSATWCPEDLHSLARACIFAMYPCSSFSLEFLKHLFLFNEIPTTATGQKRTMKVTFNFDDCIDLS